MKYKTRFLLFFVAMALFHLAANFAHPVTPTIIQELGLPDYMFGLMLAVMMIANFALSPSWGNINRFISSRESLLICCVGYAAAQLGLPANECMALEDSPNGVRSASDAGCVTVMVPDLTQPDEELTSRIFAKADSLADVPGIIEKMTDSSLSKKF